MDQCTRNSLSLLNFWQMGFMWVLALLWSYILLWSRKFIGSERTFPSCPPDIHHNLACIVTGVVEEFKMRHKRVLVRAMEVDLTSISSILKFKDNVEELLKAQDAPTSLQLLINNAGILATTQRTTSEGCDYMIASNYLGHFMLTQLLLPLMCKGTESVRIVNVGSFTHRCGLQIQESYIQEFLGNFRVGCQRVLFLACGSLALCSHHLLDARLWWMLLWLLLANQVSTFTEDVGGQWFPLLYHMIKDLQKVCGNHLLNFMKLHWPSTGECFELSPLPEVGCNKARKRRTPDGGFKIYDGNLCFQSPVSKVGPGFQEPST